MMRVILVSILLFIVVAIQLTEAQQFHTRTYTEADGLANSTVYDVVQDSNGIMWFATRSGISSYNGSTWKSFTVKDGLLQPAYEKLFIDKKGHLWAFTALNGICVSFFEMNHWSSLFCSDSISIQTPVSVFEVIYQDSLPQIIIGTYQQGLWLYKEGNWINFNKDKGLPSNQVNDIQYFYNKIYIATSKGLSILRDNKIITSLTTQPGLPSKNILALHIDNADDKENPQIWMLGDNWLGYIKDSEISVVNRGFNIMTDNKYFNAILIQDSHNGLYFGNVFYLYHLDIKKNELNRIGMKNGLISEGATEVLEDREKNIWITGLRGVTKIPPKLFINYTKDDGLFDNEVTSIEKIKPGYYVLGHTGGLSFYDNNTFKTYDIEVENDNIFHEIRVQDIAVDKAKNIWIAASYKGLAKLDKNRKITWYHNKEGLKGNVMSVVIDNKGDILVCSEKGLFVMKENRFVPVEKINKASKNLRKIFKTKDDDLYIGTFSEGLIEIKDGKVNNYLCGRKNCSNNVYAFLEDSKGRKWVGTWNGLHMLKDDTLVKLKPDSIRIDNPVYLIMEDHQNNIWFGSDNGLYRFDGGKLRHYTMSDGLSGMEANRDAALVEEDRIWIGTNNGLSIYNPKYDVNVDEFPAPIVTIMDIKAEDGSLPIHYEASLPYNINNFCFTFAGISFLDEEKVYYQCKLEGFDKNWREEFRSLDNKYCYFNLPPGNYRFCIKARNKLGIWSKPVCTKLITINKPFWLQWWFITIFSLVILLLLYLFLRMAFRVRYSVKLKKQVEERTKKLKESEDKLKELNDTKDRFFSIIAHDLKSPFNAILGLSDVLKTEYESLTDEEIKELVQNLHLASSRSVDLLDNLLNWARSQKGTIPFNPDYFNLNLLIEENFSIFESSANKKQISLINLVDMDTKIFADRNMIDTVVRNLISNAIKFTNKGGRISISSRENEKFVEVCVRDNGTGIDQNSIGKLFKIEEKVNTKGTDNEGGTGLGLVLCKDFIIKNGGDI